MALSLQVPSFPGIARPVGRQPTLKMRTVIYEGEAAPRSNSSGKNRLVPLGKDVEGSEDRD